MRDRSREGRPAGRFGLQPRAEASNNVLVPGVPWLVVTSASCALGSRGKGTFGWCESSVLSVKS